MEKKSTIKALQDQIETLSNMISSAADGICVCHNIPEFPYVRFTHWNPRMYEITGYTMEEINRHGWYQSLYKDRQVRQKAIERMAEMRAGQDIHAEEWRITAKNGVNKHLSISTSIVKAEYDQVHVLAVIQDITERKKVDQALAYELEFQRALAEIANDFINIPLNHIDEAVDRALQTAGEFAGADRSYVILFDFQSDTLCNTHEWCRRNIESQRDNLQEITLEPFRWIIGQLADLHDVHIPKLADMPADAASAREEFESEGIRSLLLVPVISEGKCIGTVGFDFVNQERFCTKGEIRLLRMLGATFSNALERKHAEAALQESNSRLQQMADTIDDIFWLVDWETKATIFASSAYERICGRKLQDLYDHPKSRLETVHIEDRDNLSEKFLRLDEGGQFDETYRIVLPDGSIRRLRDRAFPIFDETGHINRVAGIAQDITEHLRKESITKARLELSELSTGLSTRELLQAFLDKAEELTGSTIGFFHFIDSDQQTIHLQTWSTRTLTDMCTTDVDIRHYPIDKAGVWADCVRQGRALVHNDYYSLSNRRGLPEGHAPIIRELVVPVHRDNRIVAILGVGNKAADYCEDDLTTVSELAGVAWDIIARKQAEEALRESEERYRSILKSAMDGYCMTDIEGKIIDVNESYCTMSQYTESELLKMRILDLKATEDPDQLNEHIKEVTLKGYDRFESKHRKKDGTIYDVEVSVQFFMENGGRLVSFIRDITKRKRADYILKQYQEKLEHMVEDRTLALFKAKEEAEIANKAKSEFLANMSHEIRTPMNSLIGFSQVLKDQYFGSLNMEQQEYVDYILESGNRLLYLINDILDYSKIEAGKLEIRVEEFNLRELLHDIYSTTSILASKKALQINIIINDNVPERIKSDAYRLDQILRNLISNAIKFTEEGFVTISVNLAGENELLFSVEDTGIGIETKKIDQIFDAFVQADSSTTKVYGGTGLGLAISRQLVSGLGGRIWVQSEIGKGTTFFFTIKLVTSQDELSEKSCERVSPKVSPVSEISRNFKVLLVEDDHFNQKAISFFLKRAGHTVTIVDNGRMALDALMHNKFDIVLMDVQMPEMDGVEAARSIRSFASNNINTQIPIIALTAYAMVGDKEKFLAAGMNDYVTKPVDYPVLLMKMVQLLAN